RGKGENPRNFSPPRSGEGSGEGFLCKAPHVHEVGIEWLVEATGCLPERLRDGTVLRSLLERLLRELELQVVGAGHWHQFPGPGGVTALYLLTESHLACHTYPEYGVATFNLYCCRRRQ